MKIPDYVNSISDILKIIDKNIIPVSIISKFYVNEDTNLTGCGIYFNEESKKWIVYINKGNKRIIKYNNSNENLAANIFWDEIKSAINYKKLYNLSNSNDKKTNTEIDIKVIINIVILIFIILVLAVISTWVIHLVLNTDDNAEADVISIELIQSDNKTNNEIEYYYYKTEIYCKYQNNYYWYNIQYNKWDRFIDYKYDWLDGSNIKVNDIEIEDFIPFENSKFFD